MARSKNVDIYKTIKRYDPKLRKVVKEQVKIGTKSTNVTKGGNTTLRTDASKLKAQAIAERGQTDRAKIAAKSTNVANIAAQIGSTIRQGLGSQMDIQKGSTAQKLTTANDAGVDQNVNGGIASGSNSRDEDSDSPWVD